MTPPAPQIRVQDIDHCGIVAGIIENVPRGWGMGRRGDKETLGTQGPPRPPQSGD
ncbi:hypothetical protein [Chlorogloeopsis sp. ULAP02]|uniref:hypothetical protein n=1 Tax=Chlorogloeopsis sp. ULAP02 TaxID=3107926 RepID=UPI003136E717